MIRLTLPSPWGELELFADDGRLQAVHFAGTDGLAEELAAVGGGSGGRASASAGAHERQVLDDTARQLDEYAQGRLSRFELPLMGRGTDFQQRIWSALASKVPLGTTVSYAQLAALAGRPRAVRAVGNAVGANPWVIVVPCHRVLAVGCRLGGFSSGLERKRGLLRHEGIAWLE